MTGIKEMLEVEDSLLEIRGKEGIELHLLEALEALDLSGGDNNFLKLKKWI